MHHLAVKSNLVEGTTTKLGYDHGGVGGGGGNGGNCLPVCPKPRRPKSSIPPEILKSIKCTNTHSQTNPPNGRSEILDMMISDKITEERESFCYYSGSPPRRTGNPLVHDVHFIHQVELFAPLASLKN